MMFRLALISSLMVRFQRLFPFPGELPVPPALHPPEDPPLPPCALHPPEELPPLLPPALHPPEDPLLCPLLPSLGLHPPEELPPLLSQTVSITVLQT
jgi:hypothetical protein